MGAHRDGDSVYKLARKKNPNTDEENLAPNPLASKKPSAIYQLILSTNCQSLLGGNEGSLFSSVEKPWAFQTLHAV